MEDNTEAVGRVIASMRENLGEQLTIDDLARTAMFSKFHFSRLFLRVTGVSPGRFLSAMRLHAAKQLLVETPLTVTEISHRVGYTSVGTFSSRFAMNVGVSPSTYRQLGGYPTPSADPSPAGPGCRRATVGGTVGSATPDRLGMVFVGLFAEAIPRGQPVSCTMVHRAGSYQLDNVPPGSWYLLAHSVLTGGQPAGSGQEADDQTLCLGSAGEVKVAPGATATGVDVWLQPMHRPDPPVLRALLDVQAVGLTIGAA